MARTAIIAGRIVDLDHFAQKIRDFGERFKAEDEKMGQRIAEKAPEIASWYVKHQSLMRTASLRKILEEI